MIKLKKEVDMINHTLILPSVAFGNVGQLAVDLLISSLKLQRIGYLMNNAFIPIIGADPYDENSTDLCTTVDLFHGPEKKIVVLQIRSPLVKKPTSFFTELIQFITERKIKKVVILTSSYGHEQRDAQLRTVPLRYVASPSMLEECGNQFKNLNWIKLEPKVIDFINTGENLYIPGGGFAKSLLDTLASANIPSIILLRFCSEGDNIPEAVELTNYLNNWLNIIQKEESGTCRIEYPPSWKFLFGNPPPLELY